MFSLKFYFDFCLFTLTGLPGQRTWYPFSRHPNFVSLVTHLNLTLNKFNLVFVIQSILCLLMLLLISFLRDAKPMLIHQFQRSPVSKLCLVLVVFYGLLGAS